MPDFELNNTAATYIEHIARISKEKKPLVAIQCMTYNHELYLRDSLEGFLMQRTTFPFVVIVHDDASTDSTTNILIEYAKKYPDIILPIIEKENQYSKGNGSVTKIMTIACEATRAKYIAFCEGDDYWINPYKLQIQVDFLESHSEYSMCFHNVEIKQQEIKELTSINHYVKNKDYLAEEVLSDWIIATCSVLMRFECVKNKPNNNNFIVGDNVLWASCLSIGKLKGLNDCMGVYRQVNSGWTAQANDSRRTRYKTSIKWINHYKAMIQCFPNIDKSIFEKKILENMATITRTDILNLNIAFFKHFLVYFKEFGLSYVKQIFIRYK